MATKTSEYEKFKAIQANNEEIATQDFAGLTRRGEGWFPKSSTARAVLGGQPLLKAGGKGAMVLDAAMTEPKPKTLGQSVLKAAGKWKPLNEHYRSMSSGGAGTMSSGGTQATGGGGASAEDVTPDAPLVPELGNEGARMAEEQAARENGQAAQVVAQSMATPKTYTVNGRQMTLGEYIKSIGTDPQAQYRQTVAAANAAYDRQRATYGAEAEALASAGLMQSGTSEYADSQAYAAKQKAISDATIARNQQMNALGAQYSSYQRAEQAEYEAKVQTAIDRANAMQLNEANTVKYLMAMVGMTKAEAEQYAQSGAVLTAESEEDTTRATLQEIDQLYRTYVSTDYENGGRGMSDAAARDYLKSEIHGYDAAMVDQVADTLVGAYEETEAKQKTEAQKATAEVIEAIWNDSYTNEEIIATLAKVGVTLEQSEDGVIDPWDTMNAITNAYMRGAISEENYQSLHRKNIDQATKDAVEDKSLGDLLQTVADYSHDAGLERYAVEKISQNILVGDAKGRGNDVQIKVKVNGKVYDTYFVYGDGEIPKTVLTQESQKGDVYVYGNKLYYCISAPTISGTQGQWKEISSTGKTNAIGGITSEQYKMLYKAIVKNWDNKWE